MSAALRRAIWKACFAARLIMAGERGVSDAWIWAGAALHKHGLDKSPARAVNDEFDAW